MADGAYEEAVHVAQVLDDEGWRTIATACDLDYLAYCLSYRAYNGLTKRLVRADTKADPSVCRCSHGFSCHVCEGCEDHHEPACPRSAPVEQGADQ